MTPVRGQHLGGLALAWLAASLPLQAAEWRGDAGLEGRVIYTDNVCLRDEDQRSELINTVTPSVSLSGDGANGNLDLFASLQWNDLSDETLEDRGCNPRGIGRNRQQIAPRLRANGSVVLVDDWLYLNANASAYQERIDPFGVDGEDGLDRTGNTTNVYRYGLSPHLSHRFKNLAVLSARYNWNERSSSDEVVGDSEQQLLTASLNDAGYTPVIWGVSGNYRETTYTETLGRPTREDNVLAYAQASLGYRFSRKWSLVGFAGRDFNDYSSRQRRDIDGEFWNVNLSWTPTRRTAVSVGYGDRFFGDTPSLSISHRHKRHVFDLSYSKMLTYDRDIRNPYIPAFEDEFGRPLDPDLDEFLRDFFGFSSTLTNSPIIDERMTMSWALRGRLTTYRLAASLSDQERLEDGRESEFRRVNVSVDRHLSRSMTVFANLKWQEGNPGRGVSNFDSDRREHRASLGVRRQLAEHLTMAVTYDYTDRESNNPTDTYQENRVMLSLGYQL